MCVMAADVRGKKSRPGDTHDDKSILLYRDTTQF